MSHRKGKSLMGRGQYGMRGRIRHKSINSKRGGFRKSRSRG